jgi:2-oxo-4-hydroxy-4-carboxy-5-ureidoimidazoline decarboxylase
VSAAARLDRAADDEARALLHLCCGSMRWAAAMAARRPFASDDALLRAAAEEWARMGPDDVREALAHHPRIGASLEDLRAKFAATANWAAGEQADARLASEATLRALAAGNAAYETRFGYVFVVCATGKTADEMLALLRARLVNDPEHELRVAAAEHAKITRIRLEKLR